MVEYWRKAHGEALASRCSSANKVAHGGTLWQLLSDFEIYSTAPLALPFVAYTFSSPSYIVAATIYYDPQLLPDLDRY